MGAIHKQRGLRSDEHLWDLFLPVMVGLVFLTPEEADSFPGSRDAPVRILAARVHNNISIAFQHSIRWSWFVCSTVFLGRNTCEMNSWGWSQQQCWRLLSQPRLRQTNTFLETERLWVKGYTGKACRKQLFHIFVFRFGLFWQGLKRLLGNLIQSLIMAHCRCSGGWKHQTWAEETSRCKWSQWGGTSWMLFEVFWSGEVKSDSFCFSMKANLNG